MIIEALLHIRGSEMNLYSPSYFKRGISPVDPIRDLTGGSIFAYGKEVPATLEPCRELKTFGRIICLDTTSKMNAPDSITDYLSEDGRDFEGLEISYPNKTIDLTYNDLYVIKGRQRVFINASNFKDYFEEIEAPDGWDSEASLYEAKTGITIYEHVGYEVLDKLSDYTGPCAIDLRAFCAAGNTWEFGVPTNENYKQFKISNPPVPPMRWKVDDNTEEMHDYFLGWWLGHYNGSTPNYFTEKDSDIVTTVKDGDITFGLKRNITKLKNALPFINGLACFPNQNLTTITVHKGKEFYQNPNDRDRGYVLVDFTPVGGATFIETADLYYDKHSIVLPEEYDSTKNSFFLVVAGRLFCSDELDIEGRTVIFNKQMYRPEYELDRKLCRNEFDFNTHMLTTEDGDFLRDPNSFIVIVNKPNLQVVRHPAFYSSQDQRRNPDPKTVSYENIIRNAFDVYARGIMFDTATRSVTDYLREEHTQTFYASKTGELVDWKRSTTTINPQMPLVLFSRNSDNLMSARGAVLRHKKPYLNDTIIWPKFVILDFVFRG